MSPSRRDFLGLAATALSAAALGGCQAGPDSSQAKASKAKLTGQLITVGTDGHLMPGYTKNRRNEISVLTSVDMKSGKALQTPLEMAAGHSALPLGDGRVVCVSHHKETSMVVDEKHNVLATFKTPKDYLYGGHGLLLPGQDKFILCTRFRRPMSGFDHGRYEVYDMKTLKQLDRIDSGGLHPHEIQEIPGTDELIATHYGDDYAKMPPFAHNLIEPKLTVYDAKTLQVKRHYVQPGYHAMVTHMRVTKDKNAYFVLTQYIDGAIVPTPKDSQGKKIKTTALSRADAELEKFLGHKRDFPIPYEAAQELMIPLPLPFVCLNTQTGEKKDLMTGEANHLRSQSVGYNEKTNTAIGIFYHSDTAILHRPGEDAQVLKAGDIGLSELRGVADIPGTSCVGLVAAHRGLIVYDLDSKEVVMRFPHQYFDTVHLSLDQA